MYPLVVKHYDENFAIFSEWGTVVVAASDCSNNMTIELILIIFASF